MMKLQDVILKAIAGRITWMAAAEIAGVSDRTMRRMKNRYQESGYDGLFDQRRGKRSIHRIPMETSEKVLRLYQEVYYDFNVKHFHEKLEGDHSITVSYNLNWVFSVQTERVADKDNTVAIGSRWWQIDKCRWRYSLANQTVTIHEHLDETVSIRFGPRVVGRYDSAGQLLPEPAKTKRRGKDGAVGAGENQNEVATGSHRNSG